MTWTPGPWEWDGAALKAGPDEYVLWTINALSEPTDTREAIGACGARAESDANDNAKLIALAPDMAAMLKRLYAAYEADPAEMIDMGAELGRFLRRLPV